MINLTIYGKPSSSYAYMKKVIDKTANQANITLNLEEVTSTQDFIDRQVMSIPAYQLNGTIEEKGEKTINQFLRELQLSLLKKANYGDMKKIFVPINFTETSDNAVSFALNLGKHFNSAIKLIHAYRPAPLPVEGTFVDPELLQDREKQLKQFTQQLNKQWIGDSNSPVIDAEMKVGLAFDQIQKISETHQEDWIVIGSTNSSKNIKNVFGSVSTDIAKSSECPVFIVPPSASFTPFKKIAYCSSDGMLDTEALSDLLFIANAFNSEIHVIHFIDNSDYDEFDLLHVLKDNYPSDKIKFSFLSGDSQVEAINSFCQKEDIQLLAMARRKRSIFKEFFHRSFTKKLTISTEIPLLILHK